MNTGPVVSAAVRLTAKPFIALNSDGGPVLACRYCAAVSIVADLAGDARNTSHMPGCKVGEVLAMAWKPILLAFAGEGRA